MREFSEKEIEQLYKEQKLNEIPDLWKNIEGNLAPKNTTTNVVKQEERKNKKRHFSVRWLAGMAAVLVVALLAVPGWQMLNGGTKSSDNNASSMEFNKSEGAAAPMEEADAAAPMDCLDEGDGNPLMEEPEDGQEWQAAKENKEKHCREVELTVEQVQAVPEGLLVTGEILTAEEYWFETGEQVTFFYEGTDYGEEDFSGTIRVILDPEEENLKILEILP